MERPCDIVSSLKRSRQSLKQEMQERSRRTKEAIQVRRGSVLQNNLWKQAAVFISFKWKNSQLLK